MNDHHEYAFSRLVGGGSSLALRRRVNIAEQLVKRESKLTAFNCSRYQVHEGRSAFSKHFVKSTLEPCIISNPALKRLRTTTHPSPGSRNSAPETGRSAAAQAEPLPALAQAQSSTSRRACLTDHGRWSNRPRQTPRSPPFVRAYPVARTPGPGAEQAEHDAREVPVRRGRVQQPCVHFGSVRAQERAQGAGQGETSETDAV